MFDIDGLARSLSHDRDHIGAVPPAFRELFQSLPFGVMVADAEGRVLYANDASRRVDGPGLELPVYDCREGGALAHRQLPLPRALAGESVRNMELCVRRPGAEPARLRVSAAPLTRPDGRRAGALVAFQDVTEEHRLRDELDHARAQAVRDRSRLEAATEELDALSHAISHELRGPFRAISGYAMLLAEREQSALGPEGLRTLARLLGAVRRLSHRVDQLLSLSRVTRAPLRRERVDLAVAARRTAEALQKASPLRRVRWTIFPVWVWGDPALLSVVVEALLDNAFKFTAKRPEAVIELGAKAWEGGKAVYVRDNGDGFEPDQAQFLFKGYVQHAGTGYLGLRLGLHLVQRIVRRHGGRAWAEGARDRGACVWFWLPEESAW